MTLKEISGKHPIGEPQPRKSLATILGDKSRLSPHQVWTVGWKLVTMLGQGAARGEIHGRLHAGSVLVGPQPGRSIEVTLLQHAALDPAADDAWLAPELRGAEKLPTQAGDVYALGGLLWELRTRQRAFPDGEGAAAELRKSELLLLQKMLATTPAQRPDLTMLGAEIVKILHELGPIELGTMKGSGGPFTLREGYHVKQHVRGMVRVFSPTNASSPSLRAFVLASLHELSRLPAEIAEPILECDALGDGTVFAFFAEAREQLLMSQRLDGELSFEQALNLALSTACCAEATHAAGLVAANLSPLSLTVQDTDPAPRVRLNDLCHVQPVAARVRPEAYEAWLRALPMNIKAYMAPEARQADAVLGPACMVFSVAAILLHALTGQVPDSSEAGATAADLPSRGERYAPIMSRLSQLLSTALSANAGERPALTQLQSELAWLRRMARRIEDRGRSAGRERGNSSHSSDGDLATLKVPRKDRLRFGSRWSDQKIAWTATAACGLVLVLCGLALWPRSSGQLEIEREPISASVVRAPVDDSGPRAEQHAAETPPPHWLAEPDTDQAAPPVVEKIKKRVKVAKVHRKHKKGMRRRKSEQAVEIESSPPPSVSEAYVRQEFKESDQALMKDPADHGALQRILRLARGIRENKLIELACRVHAVARNYCERVTSRMQSSVIDQLEQAVATLRDCCASETMSAAMFAQCRDRVSPRWMDGLSISQNKP